MNATDNNSTLDSNYLKIESGPEAKKAKSLGLFGLFSLGLKKSRINLSISKTSNESFNIAAEQFSGKHPLLSKTDSKKFILIKAHINEGDSTFLKVNRNSLVKRLGINEKDLKKAETRGIRFLSNFIAVQVEALKRDSERAEEFIKNPEQFLERASTQLFNFNTQAPYLEKEESFKLINAFMRVVDPADALLEALGKEKALHLKALLKSNAEKIEHLHDDYKVRKEDIKKSRKAQSKETGYSPKDVRHIAVYGTEMDKLYAKSQTKAGLNKNDLEKASGIIEQMIGKLEKNQPLPNHPYLNIMGRLITNERLIIILKLPNLNPFRMLSTLKEISDYVAQPNPKHPHYAKQLKGKTFGWATDNQGHIYIRTGNIKGKGASKKVTTELCINTLVPYASSAITGNKNIRDALLGNKMAKFLIKLGIPNIQPPALASYESYTKAHPEKPSVKKLILRMPLQMEAAENYINKKETTPHLSAQQLLKIGLALSDTLTQMHALGYVHADIKPANILLTEDRVFLIDFDGTGEAGTRLNFGTIRYAPPEITLNTPETKKRHLNKRTKEHDAYSLGITLIDLMTNRLAGALSVNNERYKHTKFNSPDFYKTILSEKGAGLDAFIQDLKDGVSQRYEGDELKRIDQMLEVVKGLINPNPAERITCETAYAELSLIT